MCLIAKKPGDLVRLEYASEDIVAYKVVISTGNKYTEKRKFLSGFMYKEITDAEIRGINPFSAPYVIPFPETQSRIEGGCIHSYINLKDALWYMQQFVGTADHYPTIFKVIIPKDTPYYKGVQITANGFKDSYASEKIVFKEQMYCRIKNTDYEYKKYKVEEDEQNKKKKLSHEKDPFE